MERQLAWGGSSVKAAVFFEIVEIVVTPEYQQGLGDRIMAALMFYLSNHAPDGAYISLMADIPADTLYVRHGFQYAVPAELAMFTLNNTSP